MSCERYAMFTGFIGGEPVVEVECAVIQYQPKGCSIQTLDYPQVTAIAPHGTLENAMDLMVKALETYHPRVEIVFQCTGIHATSSLERKLDYYTHALLDDAAVSA